MIAVKAKFDGKQVILPDGLALPAAGEVLVLFDAEEWDTSDPGYLAATEQVLGKIWDNPDDEVFDAM